ncbi:MAG: phage tail protein [Chloroflexi bacterium]|nr:phage tail protein [Chloroflexota bacterium]
MTRDDPYAQFNFLVELDGVAAAGFTEVGGLAVESDVIEYRNGNEDATVRKLPGLRKYSNITLKRGYTANLELWKWRKTTEDGQTARRSGAIILLDEARQPVLRWIFREGWIAKYEGPALNSTTNEAAIESIEIAHEGLTLEA